MLAGIGRATVADSTYIDRVPEQVIQGAPAVGMTATTSPFARHPDLADDPLLTQLRQEGRHVPEFQVSSEDQSNSLGFGVIHNELAVLYVVTQRQVTAACAYRELCAEILMIKSGRRSHLFRPDRVGDPLDERDDHHRHRSTCRWRPRARSMGRKRPVEWRFWDWMQLWDLAYCYKA